MHELPRGRSLHGRLFPRVNRELAALDPLPLSGHEYWKSGILRDSDDSASSLSPIRGDLRRQDARSPSQPGSPTSGDEPHGRELVWVMLANRGARGLASLRVQNKTTLKQASQLHAGWLLELRWRFAINATQFILSP